MGLHLPNVRAPFCALPLVRLRGEAGKVVLEFLVWPSNSSKLVLALCSDTRSKFIQTRFSVSTAVRATNFIIHPAKNIA